MSGDLELRAPDPARDREALFDLTAKVFGGPFGYWNWVRYCREGYWSDRMYDWSASRVGLIDGRLVTHFGIWGYRMRIGSATIPVAGVGAVATHGEFRKRGLMDRTAREVIPRLAEAGYPVSILFGIGGFYHRFGYAVGWPEEAYRLAVNDLPRLGDDAGMGRPATAADRETIDSLYNAENAEITGTVVRPSFDRYRFGESRGFVIERKGRIRGYFFFEKDHGRWIITDVAGDPDGVLPVLRQQAEADGIPSLRFSNLPRHSRMARRLRLMECEVRTEYQANGGPMIAVLDPASAIEQVLPELDRRVAASSLEEATRHLWIATDYGDVHLTIRGDGCALSAPLETAHVIEAGRHFGRLLIGTAPPEDLADRGDIGFHGDALRFASALFPAQEPGHAEWDMY